MYTINPTKITPRFPLLNPTQGVQKFGFPRFLQQNRGFKVESIKKMAWSLETVRPATEVYADEAVKAVKDGKVIAVPTDTLYGFACDACERAARLWRLIGYMKLKGGNLLVLWRFVLGMLEILDGLLSRIICLLGCLIVYFLDL